MNAKEIAETVSDEAWDQHAVQCGNCGLSLITKGGISRKNGDRNLGLSDTGGSEDEALCGMCAGEEMYRLMDENGALERTLDQTLTVDRERFLSIVDLTRQRDGYKADLDRIAGAVYPRKERGFTYATDFIVAEIHGLRERDQTAKRERDEVECITKDRDSWREQSREHNINLIKCREQIAELTRQRDEAESARKHTQDWYGSRWQEMSAWFRTAEMIGTKACDDWFSIVANGTTMESPPVSFMCQVNMDRHKIEALTARANQLERDSAVDRTNCALAEQREATLKAQAFAIQRELDEAKRQIAAAAGITQSC